MTRRALLVGIDHYEQITPLKGCAADATAMHAVLARHESGTPNYACRLYCGTKEQPITRAALRGYLGDLFTDARGDVLFYFAGHGAVSATGGYLCTTDAAWNDLGVAMDEVLQLASRSPARSVLIVLDCCHAGSLGNAGVLAASLDATPIAVLRQDVTIIAAARGTEEAKERGGHGVFTAALLDALKGGAKDMLGYVSAPAVYSYAERRFDAWEQRPVYKSHATDVAMVRQCKPAIDAEKLRNLPRVFETGDAKLKLDPEYDPQGPDGVTRGPVNEEKVTLMKLLREYRNLGLLRATVPGEELWWTAQNGNTVELTERGQEFWWLAQNGKL